MPIDTPTATPTTIQTAFTLYSDLQSPTTTLLSFKLLLYYINTSTTLLSTPHLDHTTTLSRPDYPIIERTCHHLAALTSSIHEPHEQRNTRDVGVMREELKKRVRFLKTVGKAAGEMLGAVEEERRRYLGNMRVLLEYARVKIINEGPSKTLTRLGDSGMQSLHALAELVNDIPLSAETEQQIWHCGTLGKKCECRGKGPRGRYLSEIARYWRQWGDRGESKEFEEVWTWVAGRGLLLE